MAFFDFEREAKTLTAEALAETLRTIGCHSEGRPYVVRGLVRQLEKRFQLYTEWVAASRLAMAFLDEASCPGAHGLPEVDKSELRRIRDLAPPPSAAPAPSAQAAQ